MKNTATTTATQKGTEMTYNDPTNLNETMQKRAANHAANAAARRTPEAQKAQTKRFAASDYTAYLAKRRADGWRDENVDFAAKNELLKNLQDD